MMWKRANSFYETILFAQDKKNECFSAVDPRHVCRDFDVRLYTNTYQSILARINVYKELEGK